jgi:hypothetical protein
MDHFFIKFRNLHPELTEAGVPVQGEKPLKAIHTIGSLLNGREIPHTLIPSAASLSREWV